LKTKFTPSKEMQVAMSWCLKNGIKQYLVPNLREFWIVVDQQGKKTKSSKKLSIQFTKQTKEISIFTQLRQNSIMHISVDLVTIQLQ